MSNAVVPTALAPGDRVQRFDVERVTTGVVLDVDRHIAEVRWDGMVESSWLSTRLLRKVER